MTRWSGLLCTLLSAGALAAPGAQELFSGCTAGAPANDVLARPMPADFWAHGPVLAVFWSIDCAFCHRHNDRLNRLLKAELGAAVVGIAVDGDTASVQATVKKRGYGFPVIQDRCGLREQLTTRKLVPMTCWLGAAPSQPQCIPGEMAEDDLRELLRQARSSRHS